MAENTRLQALQGDIRRLMDQQTILQQQLQEQHELVSQSQAAQVASNARMDRIESALEALTQNRGNAHSQFDESGSSHAINLFQVRNVKLEFPKFDGSNVMEWIFQAEQFFSYYRTPDLERLTIAAIHMEKNVLPWFQMLQKTDQLLSWSALLTALESEFGPSPFECARASLFKLTQQTTVNAYYLEFMSLANRISGLSPEAILDCFVSGLKLDIRREVLAQAPVSLVKVVSLAKLYEEKYVTNFRTNSAPQAFKPFQHSMQQKFVPKSTLPPLLPTPHIAPLSTQKNFVRKVSPAEMQLRREKGLCYTCDEKFSVNHRCPNKNYMILVTEEESDMQSTQDSTKTELQEDASADSAVHLSFNALHGSQDMDIIKFQGLLQGIPIQVLIDGGSNDNFFTTSNCQILEVGSGTSTRGQGQSRKWTVYGC